MSGNEEEQTMRSRTSLEALGAGKKEIWQQLQDKYVEQEQSVYIARTVSQKQTPVLQYARDTENREEGRGSEGPDSGTKSNGAEQGGGVSRVMGRSGASLPSPGKYHFHFPSPY